MNTVLHLRSSSTFDGPARYVLELAAAIQEFGWATRVLVLTNRARPGGTQHPFAARAHDQGIHADEIESPRYLPAEPARQVAYQITRHQVAVLHTHDYKSDLIGVLVGRRTGVPVVSTVHGYTRSDWRLQVYRLVNLLTLHGVSHVILVAEDQWSGLLRVALRHRPVSVIPNGIDVEAFADCSRGDRQAIHRKLGLSESEPVLLAAGRLTPEKGFEHLVQAVRIVCDRIPEARLFIAGDGPERRRLQALTTRLGLRDNIEWLGFRTDIGELFSAADLIAVPSLREGTPYVVLEALALAKPVVATCVGGLPALIRDRETGFLVPPRDSMALSEAIIELLADREQACRLGSAGQEWVRQEFSAYRMARRTVRVYRRILQSAPAA